MVETILDVISVLFLLFLLFCAVIPLYLIFRKPKKNPSGR